MIRNGSQTSSQADKPKSKTKIPDKNLEYLQMESLSLFNLFLHDLPNPSTSRKHAPKLLKETSRSHEEILQSLEEGLEPLKEALEPHRGIVNFFMRL